MTQVLLWILLIAVPAWLIALMVEISEPRPDGGAWWRRLARPRRPAPPAPPEDQSPARSASTGP